MPGDLRCSTQHGSTYALRKLAAVFQVFSHDGVCVRVCVCFWVQVAQEVGGQWLAVWVLCAAAFSQVSDTHTHTHTGL